MNGQEIVVTVLGVVAIAAAAYLVRVHLNVEAGKKISEYRMRMSEEETKRLQMVVTVLGAREIKLRNHPITTGPRNFIPKTSPRASSTKPPKRD